MRFFALLVLVSVAGSSVFGEDKPSELKVPKLSKAPKIDGTLDDDAWKEAAQSDAFKLQDGGKPQGKTRFLIGQDDTNLYVAVECFEDAKQIKALKTDTTDHDGD